MTVKEFIRETVDIQQVVPGLSYQKVRPRIVCNDGFSISVQCSEMAYCTPRLNQAEYSEVELGYPSEDEPLIFKYAEDTGSYTSTVYPYTPIEVIEEVISKHGGINVTETFIKSECEKINRELNKRDIET